MKNLDLRNTITTKDLLEIFGVSSETTLWKWRRQHGLDECAIRIDANERYFIRFGFPCVIAWARENNKPLPGMKQWKKKNKGKEKNKRVRLG